MSTNKSRSMSNRCCTHSKRKGIKLGQKAETKTQTWRIWNDSPAYMKQNSGCDAERARIPDSFGGMCRRDLPRLQTHSQPLLWFRQ
jgi:hypothetical protein